VRSSPRGRSLVGDSLVTGPAVRWFMVALAVPVGLSLWLIGATNPRRADPRQLKRGYWIIGDFLWTRGRTRQSAVLAVMVIAGAAVCCTTYWLPFVTFTSPPQFPGDPFAGPMEHDPTARGLALVFGILMALLAVRRLAGGEGNTVVVTVILAAVLEFVAALAIADWLSNAQSIPGPYGVAVTPGIGLLVLPLGCAIAFVGSAFDVVMGLRRASRRFRASGVIVP
jgi:hypothetical protein